MNNRGQMSINHLILLFVLVAIFGVLASPLVTFIELGTNATNDTTDTILNLLTVFFVLGIIITIFNPRRREPAYPYGQQF